MTPGSEDNTESMVPDGQADSVGSDLVDSDPDVTGVGSSAKDVSTEKTRGWPLAFVLTLLLGLAVTLTPFYSDAIRGGVMQAFSFVCHQLPGRSPHVGGIQLAVCHRCMGIYWALPVATLVFGFSRGFRFITRFKNLTIVLAAGIPSGVDWLGDILGFWDNTPESRLITGAIFGLVAGYFLAEGISDVVRERRAQKRGVLSTDEDSPETGAGQPDDTD